MRLVFGHDAEVADWVAARIPHVGTAEVFGPLAAIGVADGGEMIAGVIYHNYLAPYRVGEMSFAGASPRWATRGVIRALLSVPFEQYKWRRLSCLTPHTNTRAVRMLCGLGFKREGVARELFAPGVHGVVLGMVRREYERLKTRMT